MRQTRYQRFRFDPFVSLDKPNFHIDPVPEQAVCLLQHPIRLSHARAHADIYLELPPARFADERQKAVSVLVVKGHCQKLTAKLVVKLVLVRLRPFLPSKIGSLLSYTLPSILKRADGKIA